MVDGPFTRIDPADNHKKSVLDLCIISKALYKYVDSLIIDKKRHFTPYRAVTRSTVRYTDHFSLLLSFKGLPLKSNSALKEVIPCIKWNTNREGGWEQYEEMTTNNKILDNIAVETDGDPETMMNKFDKEVKRIKYKAFGKVKVKFNCKSDKELKSLQLEKQSIQVDGSAEKEEEVREGFKKKKKKWNFPLRALTPPRP